jgi:hypothetical protein
VAPNAIWPIPAQNLYEGTGRQLAFRLYNGGGGPFCSALTSHRESVVEKGKKWHESTNGPDCLDVMTIFHAIGTLHSGHVALILSPDGTGSPTSVDIAASILLDVLPGSSLPAAIGVHSSWPGKSGSSFWGECYKLAWLLDDEISKVYQQESLWK